MASHISLYITINYINIFDWWMLVKLHLYCLNKVTANNIWVVNPVYVYLGWYHITTSLRQSNVASWKIHHLDLFFFPSYKPPFSFGDSPAPLNAH